MGPRAAIGVLASLAAAVSAAACPWHASGDWSRHDGWGGLGAYDGDFGAAQGDLLGMADPFGDPMLAAQLAAEAEMLQSEAERAAFVEHARSAMIARFNITVDPEPDVDPDRIIKPELPDVGSAPLAEQDV